MEAGRPTDGRGWLYTWLILAVAGVAWFAWAIKTISTDASRGYESAIEPYLEGMYLGIAWFVACVVLIVHWRTSRRFPAPAWVISLLIPVVPLAGAVALWADASEYAPRALFDRYQGELESRAGAVRDDPERYRIESDLTVGPYDLRVRRVDENCVYLERPFSFSGWAYCLEEPVDEYPFFHEHWVGQWWTYVERT